MDVACRETVSFGTLVACQETGDRDLEKSDDCIEQFIDNDGCDPRKSDGRLFAEYPLYCEGYHKPMCRGVLHLVCAIMMPTILLFFFRECRGSTFAMVVSTVYIATNTICYGASGLYHIFEWPPEPEILLQKIDHCGIALLSVGTILPDALLLFGSNLSPVNSLIGYGFASISVILCAYTCTQIWRQQPSVGLQGLVAVWWVLPFLIPNYLYMTTLEFSAMLACCAFQALGVLVFLRKSPDPLPHIFGFHEVFHLLVVSAGTCVLVVNHSIVHRYGVAYAQGKL